MKHLFDIDVTNAGSLAFNLPAEIENVYEETKIEEQNFIREVNKINEYIEKLEGDVSVAEIEAQRKRSKANIEYEIQTADADVEEKLIMERIKADAYVMSKSLDNLKCDQTQTKTIDSVSTTVTQPDNLIGYYYIMNQVKTKGYKRLYTQ